jgi:hypothetical protein
MANAITKAIIINLEENFTYQSDDFIFKSNVDLSEGVEVRLKAMEIWDSGKQIKAIACFSEYFFIAIYPQLTTFIGMDNVDFKFTIKKIN